MAIELTGADLTLESEGSFERLGRAFDSLTDEGRIVAGDEPSPNETQKVRISRTYLWLLGYINKDNGKEVPDHEYRVALSEFQSSLGVSPARARTMTETGWQALCELAQFDTFTDVDRWIDDVRALPVLERAVRLRLFSYGLIKSPPSPKKMLGRKQKKQRELLNTAIADFARVAFRLRLTDSPLNVGMNAELMRLLFSHDELMQRIQWADLGYRVFSQHPDLPLKETTARKLTKGFIGNLALVELWLLGYDVRPGHFHPDAAHGREGDGTLFAALRKFAIDHELRDVNTDQIAIAGWFFQAAHTIRSKWPHDVTVDEQKLDVIQSESKNRAALEKSYRSLGARIMDGVRRAVSWIIGVFRGVARIVKRLIRNIARAVHQRAGPIFSRLKAMVEMSAAGFRYFFSSPIPGSSLDSVYVVKRLDFDMDVFVNADASALDVDRFFGFLNLLVRAMGLGGKVIGKLWDLIGIAIRLASAPVGWVSLLMLLLKFWNWFKASASLAREFHEVHYEMDRIRSSAA